MKIIIMGATSGIGMELARQYHQQGHKVAIAGRRLERLQTISEELDNCPYAQIDINAQEATEQLQRLICLMKGMDLYVHVSGVGKQNRQLSIDIELETVTTNVVGFTRMLNCAYHYFAKQNMGHIAVVSSVAGTKGMGVAASYSASKRYCNTYIEALTQLAYMRKLNIRFTDIRPGFVDTDLLNKDYHYPMLMPTTYVVKHIIHGIAHKKRVITIDWRFRIIVSIWRLIPSSIWTRLKVG
jgi:short-subunit dehydrogenase